VSALWLSLLLGAGFSDRAEVLVPVEDFREATPGVRSPRSWWTSFGDPRLDELVLQGMDGNLDLVASRHRAEAARASAVQSLGPALPYASFDVGVQQKPCESLGFDLCAIAAAEAQEDAPETYLVGSAMLTAGLNLDVFGATVNSALAGRLEAQAAQGDAQAAALVISGQLTGAWFDLAVAQEQLAIVTEQVQLQEDLLEVTRLQLQRGISTGLDVLQQEQQLASTRASLPAARASLRQANNRLSLLLGLPPGQDFGALDLPELPGAPGTGRPSELLEARPDVRAAVDRMEASRRREKSTARAALPSVGVNAQVGRQGQEILERDTLDTWVLGASVSVPLLSGGSRGAALSSARAGTDASTASAQQALLTAITEVDSALVQERELVEQLEASRAQLQAAEAAWDSALARFAAGDVVYLQVVSSAQSLYGARLSELSAHRALLGARITLHQALGSTTLEGTP
jgi:multidrug efflux system outer membrane protein